MWRLCDYYWYLLICLFECIDNQMTIAISHRQTESRRRQREQTEKGAQEK